MRCPKCGYISFDHLERCKKCKKKIGAAVAGLDGTIFDAPVPAFLKFSLPEEDQVSFNPSPAAEKRVDRQEEVERAEPEMEFQFEGEAEEEPSSARDLTAQADDTVDEPEEMAFELDELEEADSEDDRAFTLEEEQVEEDMPATEETSAVGALDFGDMDISDLAPPSVEQGTGVQEDAGELVAALMEEPVAAQSEMASGLEDLQVGDIDLGSSVPQRSKLTNKSVKTGTALDDFEIDISELLASRKK